jgi:hypothetical protein
VVVAERLRTSPDAVVSPVESGDTTETMTTSTLSACSLALSPAVRLDDGDATA